jgi:hypothetical protein
MTNLSTETVQSLRQKGYKVRVKHYRYQNFYQPLFKKQKLEAIKDLPGKTRHPKGGLTIIELDGPQGRFVGSSVCSKLDNFCYKTGVKIALGRMEEKSNFDFFSLAKKIVDFFS